jgi:hypothetical protein
MEIVRGAPPLIPQSDLTFNTSVAQSPQTKQVFIEERSFELRLGSNENRQQIKAMFEQLPLTMPAQEGQPHFSAATGEQKAAVKALNLAWFLT